MSIQPLIWIPEIYFFLRFRQPGCELLCVRVWACRSKQPFMQCYTQGSQLFQGDLASAFVLSECIGKRQTKKPCSTYGTSGNRAQLQHRTPAEASLGSDRLHLKTAGATSGCCSPRCIGLHVLSPSFFLFCHLALLFVVFPFTFDAGKEDCCYLVLATEI